MPTTTITIKKIYRNPGMQKKSGKPYLLTKVLGNDSQYYTTFGQELKDAQEGMRLELEYAPKEEGKNDILRIISLGAATSSLDGPRAEQPLSIAAAPPAPELDSADGYARELMDRAIQMAHEKTAEWESMSEYPYLIAVLVQVMHGKISGDRIAAQEEAKLKAYGDKKW